jgi:hypothetical protein
MPFATDAHAAPQRPQCETLVLVLVSQPFVRMPSQSPKPVEHVYEHTPAEHTGEALAAAGHVFMQRPQCTVLVLRLVSQPFAALPSQSPKPGLHESPQRPAAHEGAALAPEGQTMPHVPQLAALVARSTQLDPQRVSEPQPLTQRPMAESHTGFAPVHATPQAPQFIALSSEASQPLDASRSQSP